MSGRNFRFRASSKAKQQMRFSIQLGLVYIDLFNVLVQLIENKIQNNSHLKSPPESMNLSKELPTCMSNLSDESIIDVSSGGLTGLSGSIKERSSVFHKMYSDDDVITSGKSPRFSKFLNENFNFSNRENNESRFANEQSPIRKKSVSRFKNSRSLSIQLEDLKRLGTQNAFQQWPDYPTEFMKFERNFFFFVDVYDSEPAKLPKKGLSAFNFFTSQKRNDKYISELSRIFPSVDFVKKNQKNLSQISKIYTFNMPIFQSFDNLG